MVAFIHPLWALHFPRLVANMFRGKFQKVATAKCRHVYTSDRRSNTFVVSLSFEVKTCRSVAADRSSVLYFLAASDSVCRIANCVGSDAVGSWVPSYPVAISGLEDPNSLCLDLQVAEYLPLTGGSQNVIFE